mmetsp:Transcript_38924/g.28790  ORF Transcript_38924/g.28790 Transcript_38924/m.28790 type:complete len:116 (+) Transcript_38924:526-873(+)
MIITVISFGALFMVLFGDKHMNEEGESYDNFLIGVILGFITTNLTALNNVVCRSLKKLNPNQIQFHSGLFGASVYSSYILLEGALNNFNFEYTYSSKIWISITAANVFAAIGNNL